MAAVQATLMDLGWDPRTPDLWLCPSLEQWAMQAGDHEDLDFTDIKAALATSVCNQLWHGGCCP